MTSLPAFYDDGRIALYQGDALNVSRELPSKAVDCVVTSPPYYRLRDYGVPGQYGLEATPHEYVSRLRTLFRELHRVLADDGTLWLNLADTYAGSWGNQGHDPKRADLHKKYRGAQALPKSSEIKSPRAGGAVAKNLYGIPWRTALALQDDGWILRNAIVWHKSNPMPASVRDRLTSSYEHVFLFAKQPRYWFDLDAIRTPAITSRKSALTWDRDTDAVPGQRPQHRSGRRWKDLHTPQPNLEPTGERHTAQHPDGRNPGDVWTLPTQPFTEAHFAVFPPALPQRCILAGCKPGGTVLDPFNGSGTTGLAAQRTGRRYIGIDLKREYLALTLSTRLSQAALDFEEPA
jgi:DNA modification methylase